jgi:serine/threonine-protein kinase RsbT
METLAFRQQVQSEMDIHVAIHRASVAIRDLKVDDVKTAKLKTVISELGYNIVKYAKIGTISMYFTTTGRKAIRVVATDKGPGIADISQAMRDNYSSSGTLGLGLPGVRRMVDVFDLRSEVNVGTEVDILVYIS